MCVDCVCVWILIFRLPLRFNYIYLWLNIPRGWWGDISINLILAICFSKPDEMNKPRPESADTESQNRRFLQCPGSVTVNHLKKFIINKYGLDQSFIVDVIYREDLLSQDQTLIDIAYSYNWRKVVRINLFYIPPPYAVIYIPPPHFPPVR